MLQNWSQRQKYWKVWSWWLVGRRNPIWIGVLQILLLQNLFGAEVKEVGVELMAIAGDGER